MTNEPNSTTSLAPAWMYEVADMPHLRSDGVWIDLETGFEITPRKKRKSRSAVPAVKHNRSDNSDDRAVAKSYIARSKKADISQELNDMRMPAIVLIASKLTGQKQFANKAAAIAAIKGAA